MSLKVKYTDEQRGREKNGQHNFWRQTVNRAQFNWHVNRIWIKTGFATTKMWFQGIFVFLLRIADSKKKIIKKKQHVKTRDYWAMIKPLFAIFDGLLLYPNWLLWSKYNIINQHVKLSCALFFLVIHTMKWIVRNMG